MTRFEIINELKKYFSVKELVCKEVYVKHSERSWDFLDTNYLHCLLVIRRDIIGVGMVCNDWAFGGKNQQRGLRCNRCEIVRSKNAVYLSMHVMGKAGDFVSAKMSAEEMRKRIKDNADKLPHPVRLEAGVSWLHFDTNNHTASMVVEFKT